MPAPTLMPCLISSGRSTPACAAISPASISFARMRELGNTDEALRVLKTLEPERTSDAASWQALGRLAENLAAPDLAANFYRRAIDADPKAIEPRRQLAVLLAVAGKTAEAASQFEALLAIAPSDATAHLNLAVMYAQLGRVDDARRHAREALRLQPGYQKAIDLLQALK